MMTSALPKAPDFDLFLSYARRDERIVRQLATDLSSTGLRVYFDAWQLVPGVSWHLALEHAVRQAGAVGLCVGPEPDKWSRKEARIALEDPAIKVVPILLPHARPEQLPRELAELAWVDLRDGVSAEGLERLVEATLCADTVSPEPASERGGDVYAAAGDLRAAVKAYTAALGEATDEAEVATLHGKLGRALRRLGDLDGAEAHLREAVDLTRPHVEESDTGLAAGLGVLGATLAEKGDLKQGRELAEQGVRGAETAHSLNNLAAVLFEEGDPRGALPLFRRALDLTEAAEGTDSPSASIQHINLGHVYRVLGDAPRALKHFEVARTTLEVLVGPSHPRVASALGGIGAALQAMDRPEEAEVAYRRALEIERAAVGDDNPQTANEMTNLGTVLLDLGHLDDAAKLFEEALEINSAAYGPEHPKVATDLSNLAKARRLLGDLRGAQQCAERALEIDRSVYGDGHPGVAIDLNNLGRVFLEQGRSGEALDALKSAHEIFRNTLGPEHPAAMNLDVAIERIVAPEAGR